MVDEQDPKPTGASGGIMDRVKGMLCKAKDSAETNKGFMGLLTDNKITLKNLLVSGVAVGCELLLSSEVFDCPVNHHKAYGAAFLVAPYFIVLFANLVVLGELSMLTDRGCVGKYRRWGDCVVRVIPSMIKASFGPFFWLIASFADTTYYVCSEVGQAIEKRNLTNETEIKILEEKFADAKSESHMLAWLLFAILVIVTAIVIISKRCALKDNHLLEDRFSLERREAVAAMRAFEEHTRNLNKEKHVKNGKKKPNENDGEANADPNRVTRDNESDDDTDKPEELKSETDRLMGKYKEITLYPEGAPEELAQKRVEELFKRWSKEGEYLEAYEEFAGMYPRITCGKPWLPWVSDSKRENSSKQVVSQPDSV